MPLVIVLQNVEDCLVSNFLLSIHVLGAILSIGPVAVAASMFPPAARRLAARPEDASAVATVRILHRITRVYAVIGILVPVFGVATAIAMGILTEPWLLISMTLTALAAVLLITQVIPAQRRVILWNEDPSSQDLSLVQRIGMTTGVFNLIWAVVVVMMIYRPGQGNYG